jgi:hypothetical protein
VRGVWWWAWRGAGGRCGAPPGVRTSPDPDAGHRALARYPPVWLRSLHLWCGPGWGGRAGAVRGPRISAIILYLCIGQLLSKKRTAQALAELFGTLVCEGTVAAMTTQATDGLGEFLDLVGEWLPIRTWSGSTRPGCGWSVHCVTNRWSRWWL